MKELNMTVAAIHLVDCTYLYDKHRFISSILLSLTALIGMEMPFINVISKIDLLKTLGRPDMNLSYYSAISGLKYLFFGENDNDTAFGKKYGKLTTNLCDVIENFSLVGYTLLDIHNKFSMCNVLMLVDKSNGYFHDPEKVKNPKEREIDYEAIEDYFRTEGIMDIEEKYLENDDQDDEVSQHHSNSE